MQQAARSGTTLSCEGLFPPTGVFVLTTASTNVDVLVDTVDIHCNANAMSYQESACVLLLCHSRMQSVSIAVRSGAHTDACNLTCNRLCRSLCSKCPGLVTWHLMRRCARALSAWSRTTFPSSRARRASTTTWGMAWSPTQCVPSFARVRNLGKDRVCSRTWCLGLSPWLQGSSEGAGTCGQQRPCADCPRLGRAQ